MSKYVVQSAWEDSPHLSPESRWALINSYPPHERDVFKASGPPLLCRSYQR
jgi:hypothetical protein